MKLAFEEKQIVDLLLLVNDWPCTRPAIGCAEPPYGPSRAQSCLVLVLSLPVLLILIGVIVLVADKLSLTVTTFGTCFARTGNHPSSC